jgi:Tfp pilus assembly protein PilF
MRHPVLTFLALSASLGLTACGDNGKAEVDRALKDLNVIDESGLSDIMIQAADPQEAVAYFTRTLAANPDRIDIQRGLAQSYIRADRPTEAVAAWRQVVAHPEVTDADRVSLAGALIRVNAWDEARTVLDAIPPTHESFDRYRFEAMVADADEDWARADSFYEIAVGLTTTPAGVLNNWGFSKLTRGDYRGAEQLFSDALRYDSSLFTAKNNLVLALGAQRRYDLPVVPMTQPERAQLLYTLALAAIKQNDINTGRSLLADAIETNPQHFEEAVRALEALDGSAT